MNIDEFLDSNKTIEKVGKTDILKIKYNENIDFIYKPSYGNLEYGNELHFLGIFERINKKLYGSSFDFQSKYNKEIYSNYFAGEISRIGTKLVDGANLYLKTYIEENKVQLMNNSKEIFDKYISDENNNMKIKKDAINDYIYKEDNIEMNFSVEEYSYEEHIKDLIMQYIQSPVETSKKIFDKYINNPEKAENIYINNNYERITVQENIGLMLQINQYRNMLLQELINNPNNEYKKKRDIISSIKDLDAQMVTITLKHDKEIVTFKYPKRLLQQIEFYGWYIPDLKIRDKVEKLYDNIYSGEKDELFMKEIAKIEYSRKVIYEDKELLNLDNSVTENIEGTHDIVDDMFG